MALWAHALGLPISLLPRTADGLISTTVSSRKCCTVRPRRINPSARNTTANRILAELRLLTNVQVIVPLGKIAFDAYLRAAAPVHAAAGTTPAPLGMVFCRLPNGCAPPLYHPSRKHLTGRLTRVMLIRFCDSTEVIESG